MRFGSVPALLTGSLGEGDTKTPQDKEPVDANTGSATNADASVVSQPRGEPLASLIKTVLQRVGQCNAGGQ
jgi:hypothetical protein